jgi:hypothetical protein
MHVFIFTGKSKDYTHPTENVMSRETSNSHTSRAESRRELPSLVSCICHRPCRKSLKQGKDNQSQPKYFIAVTTKLLPDGESRAHPSPRSWRSISRRSTNNRAPKISGDGGHQHHRNTSTPFINQRTTFHMSAIKQINQY